MNNLDRWWQIAAISTIGSLRDARDMFDEILLINTWTADDARRFLRLTATCQVDISRRVLVQVTGCLVCRLKRRFVTRQSPSRERTATIVIGLLYEARSSSELGSSVEIVSLHLLRVCVFLNNDGVDLIFLSIGKQISPPTRRRDGNVEWSLARMRGLIYHHQA